MIEFAPESEAYARMKVVGVGGAGGNAVNRMIEAGLTGVKFVSINTDKQALDFSLANEKIQIGKILTKGLGAGAVPEIGMKAAEENLDEIRAGVADADMVFVTAGMGGGTGTGAAPIVSRCAREQGALTVGIVSRPFRFEGDRRIARAEQGIAELRKNVDSLIIIPNEKLVKKLDPDTPFVESFRRADEILYWATKGIADLITRCGLINLDFADVRTVMSEKGEALMGTGFAKGPNAAEEAARLAIKSPLLDDIDISGARGVLVNITGGRKLTITNVSDAMESVYAAVGGDANIIFGAVIDNNLTDEIYVTVVATGFGNHNEINYRTASNGVLFNDNGNNGGQKPKRRTPAYTERHIYQNLANHDCSPEALEKPAFERYRTARQLGQVANPQDLNDQLLI